MNIKALQIPNGGKYPAVYLQLIIRKRIGAVAPKDTFSEFVFFSYRSRSR